MMATKLKDMALTAEEMDEQASPFSSMRDMNLYPYGLCLSLSNKELEKLNLDHECEIGDFIHLFAMAKVTSRSISDTGSGEQCRLELQITHMGLESEDDEDQEVMEPKKMGRARLYK